MDLIAVMASVVSAISTAVIGFLAFRLSRNSNRTSAERAIGDLANSLAQLRVDRPEILSMARTWDKAHWKRLYATGPESEMVVRYYSYVEVGLEFCNTTLRAKAGRQISEQAFADHYQSLVRYFLAENWPIIGQMVDGPYLSAFVRREISDATAVGWDWAAHHHRLVA
jgi:hypothetical protein